jgi:lantibiotic modifying enzyme
MCLIFALILIGSVIPSSSQAPALPSEDSNVYYGYYWGAAGIASGLLKFAGSGLFDPALSAILELTAINAFEEVWEHRYELENGSKVAAWTKYIDGDIYPGQKYGAAGIAKLYLEAYDYTNNEIYLNRAIESIEELFLEENVNSTYPHWSYSYHTIRDTDGIPLTDFSFGNLGVLDTTLNLYKFTNDACYLDKSLDVFKWLENVSKSITLNNRTVKLLPWYSYDTSSGSIYSSYYTGNAAAIPLFLELGRLTNNNSIIEWANDIVSAYIETQNSDGSWPIILNKQESLSRSTLDAGSAGIIISLSQLNATDYNPILPQVIENGADWLISIINRTDGQFFIPLDPIGSSGKYGILNGLGGILKAIRSTNLPKFNSILDEGYDYIMNNVLYKNSVDGVDVMGMFPSTYREQYTDLSYMDGLMGIALELYDLWKSDLGLIEEESIRNILLPILQTYLTFQTDEGVWQKQITLPHIPIPTSTNSSTTGKTDSDDEESLWWVWLLLGIPVIFGVFLNKYHSRQKK